MDKEYKIVNCTVEKVAGKPRTLRFKGSDDTLDRDNEILTIDGWDIKNYKKNPVFLFAHDHRQPPVGKANKVFIRKGEGVMFDIEFPTKDIYEFGDTIFKLYDNGFMNAVSVGFKPDRKTSDFNDETGTVTVNKKELWELSAVPVPSNPNGLIQRSAKSALDADVLNKKEYDTFLKAVEDFTKKSQERDLVLFDASELKHSPADGIKKTPTKDIILFDESEEEEEKKPPNTIAKNTAIDNNIYKDFMSIEGIKASKSASSIDSDSIAKFKTIFKEK